MAKVCERCRRSYFTLYLIPGRVEYRLRQAHARSHLDLTYLTMLFGNNFCERRCNLIPDRAIADRLKLGSTPFLGNFCRPLCTAGQEFIRRNKQILFLDYR